MPTPRLGYFLRDGTKVDSVTTILGRFKESGALINWAYKQGLAHVALYDSRDEAADIGSLAHAMANHYLRKEDPEQALIGQLPKLALPARVAFGTFVQWAEAQDAELIPCETPMVSEWHKFGGTPDFLMRTRRKLVVGNVIERRLRMSDLKTSRGIYRDMLLQVAAYGILWDENHPDDPITGGYDIARFSKGAPDFEHRHFDNLDEAKAMFLLLRQAYELDLKLKERAP